MVFYAPLSKKLKVNKAECCLEEAKLADAYNAIAVAGKAANDVILMTEKDTPMMIGELTDYGKTIGVTFDAIKPGEVIKDTGHQYNILPVEMDIEATDKQCSTFLGSLDALKKSLVKVQSFDIVPDQENRAKLKARILINIYISE